VGTTRLAGTIRLGDKGEAGASEAAPASKKRVRRPKDALREEQAELFARVVDLRSAGVSQRQRFDFSFTTDGVCARLLYTRATAAAGPGAGSRTATQMPRRGLYCIDELKRLSRKADVSAKGIGIHVVGIDPGMRELVCAVDCDDVSDPKARSERYTLKQRMRDRRSVDAAAEIAHTKSADVGLSEQQLSEHNSRALSAATFRKYLVARRERMGACLEYYSQQWHRKRRWKKCVKTQQSEERLYKRLGAMHAPDDERPLVLAYGAWGAKDASACIKKGTPPATSVGLLRKLAKRFLCAITPEFGTSSMCCKCLGPAGPWRDKEQEWGKKVRGLRVCQNESCGCPLNRDRSAAKLIGLNFQRLMTGQPTVRQMTTEEREFHRLNVADTGADGSI